ncbi:MAG: aspartyl-phosphate phosphatase Spo0E family protein [Desulfosporosinus sp.]|nr:aspartyl-phosphate phosphatase Spo0E family protein [Desulfosporosinus sp.]
MLELIELMKQIECLRLNLVKTKKGKDYTDPEVIAASQQLDAVLDQYQEKMLLNSGITLT